MKRCFKTLIALLFFPLSISAQYFNSGQDPANIKWSQIQTENFQIIFPMAFEQEAQRLANVLELVYLYDTRTLGHKPKKISVILHNFSALGNAFVAWAPRRSEFYTMPPQDIYPQDWMDQLALHEYRHVIQISKMKQGITKLLYFILGEQAVAGVLGLYIPLWFLEGDAVAAETGLSHSGRGRLPAFEMEMRTQLLGRKIYPYEKAVFGSYKDFVPNHYKLGYLLVANGRKRHGTDIWEKTLTYTARHLYNPTPFSRGIKKTSGFNKWKYYQSVMKELDSLWRIQKQGNTYTSSRQVNQEPKKVYTNYRFSQWINDSLVIAQKYGLADIEKFVLLRPDGSEEKIFTSGYSYPIWLSAKKNVIAWTEFGFDKRWENRLYSDIILHNRDTHKRTRLTKKRYLFAPALSPDASKIVAVEVTPENVYSLVILDAATGSELKKIAHPGNAFLLTPTWSEDGNFIVTALMTKQGKAIATVDIDQGVFEIILPFSFSEVSQPVNSANYIFYHGTYSGIDNIYAVDIVSKEVFQVTSSTYGAFDPAISPDGKKLSYSDYSPLGFNIAETKISPEAWISLADVIDNSIKLYEVLAIQEGGSLDFDSLPPTQYPVKRYRKFTHLINIHSWAPVSMDAGNTNTLDPQVSLLSQNKLSTVEVIAGYVYNYNERLGAFTSDVSYKAWFPVINFSSSNGGRANYAFVNGEKQSYTWRENILSLGISQPLNLTRGKYFRSVTPSTYFSFMNITNAVNAPSNFITGKIFSAQYNLEAYRLLKTAVRDMRPRWGQALLVDYKEAPYGDVNVRSMLSAQLLSFFPGISKHHSFRARLAAQFQGGGDYKFPSPISYVRGFYRSFNHREFSMASLDYKLPLLYPDLRLGPLLYLKRIKGNIFYDFGAGQDANSNITYQSIGVEITSDMHLFNFIAPLDLGFRYYYLPDVSISGFELLLGINFNDL